MDWRATVLAFNEREAIRLRMEKIAEEKNVLYQRDRELDKEYHFYIQRLRELDQRGLGSESDLVYEENVPSMDEDKQEKEYKGNLKQYDFEALKRGLSNFKKRKAEREEEETDDRLFRRDPNDRRRRGKQYNLEEVAKEVESILKEHGEPMEIHRLRDILAEKGYKWKYFLPTLPNIMKHSERIVKPYRGHITYAESADPDGTEDTATTEDTTTTEDTETSEAAEAVETAEAAEAVEMEEQKESADREQTPSNDFQMEPSRTEDDQNA
ncbi:MAG TPA: hypothetical protein VFK44_04045 [Bacillales bacterium]|nr:hypothetical protein [Bacillales bacterium]